MNGTVMQPGARMILALVAAAGLYFAPVLAQQQDPAAQHDPADPAAEQESVPADPAAGNAEGDDDETGDPAADPELDDSDLDQQTYESDDDDFVPTEEIPADEPIPFPSDI